MKSTQDTDVVLTVQSPAKYADAKGYDERRRKIIDHLAICSKNRRENMEKEQLKKQKKAEEVRELYRKEMELRQS